MGTVYQAQLLQQLVECLSGGPNPYTGAELLCTGEGEGGGGRSTPLFFVESS